MPEVNRVSGPGGPQEPGKDKSIADAKKFRELMKVQKVDDVDEDQKKKRKRKEQAEAEAAADTEENLAAQGPVTPKDADGPTSFQPIKEGLKTSGPIKADAPTAPTEKLPPPPAMPETGKTAEKITQPPATPKSQQPAESALTPQAPTGPESQEAPKEKAEQAKAHAQEKRAQAQERSAKQFRSDEEKTIRKGKEEDFKEVSNARKEEKETYFKEMSGQKKPKEETGGFRQEEPAASAFPFAPQPPSESKKPSKKEEKIESTQGVSAQIPTPDTSLPVGPPTPISSSPPSYAYLHPLVLDLYEKMVGVMTVMATAGVTETTVTLNAPEYQGSVFYGSQIRITEFSTAPKAFNIQVISNPQGIALLQENTEDLMAAFQTGKYNFRVNRFEASLVEEKPIFKRKEGVGKDEKDQEEAS
jgi:hypothetical protein